MKKPERFIDAVRRSTMTKAQKAYWEGVCKQERAQRKRARKAQKAQASV